MNEPGISTQSREGLDSGDEPTSFLVSGIVIVDPKARKMRLTPEAGQLLGITPGGDGTASLELLPRPLLDLVQEVLAKGVSPGSRRVDLTSECRNRVTLHVLAVLTHPGAPGSSLVLSLTDLSWSRSFEERLRRLDRLANAGTLATSMAHEIKNALVAGRTFIELLIEKNPDADLAEVVRRELGRIDAMIGRMLKFAAPSPVMFGQVHVHEVLEHSLRLVQPQVADKSIAVACSFRAMAALADGDEYELEQAFVNLFLNALEAMGHNGSLSVSTEIVDAAGEPTSSKEPGRPSQIRIVIQDTGHGIPAAHLDRLFEPFFTTKPNGTGLGLAVTHRVIREHRGTIRAHSRVGEGTIFTITLPRVTEAR